MVIESWRRVWREGFAPGFSVAGLQALAAALREDSPELVQGKTVEPRPLFENYEKAVCGACAVGFDGWRGRDLKTVGDIDNHFSRSCFVADQRLGVPAECRYFLNWFDETPREKVRAELLPEVERELSLRGVS